MQKRRNSSALNHGIMLRNIEIYLHFLEFRVIKRTWVVDFLPYLREDKDLPFLTVKIMAADYLTEQGATVSAAMVLVSFWISPVSAPEMLT